MKIVKQKGKFIVSLTQKELHKISSEFDGLVHIRNDLDYDGVLPKWVPRPVKLTALINGLNNTKE